MAQIEPITCEILNLRHCGVDEHCRSLGEIRILPFWWYQGKSRLFGNFSLPFRSSTGAWWYQVKPGLCWPADFLEPLSPRDAVLGLGKSYFGYQHIVDSRENADSTLCINVIRNIKAYGAEYVSSKRRNAIRKGLSICSLEILSRYEKGTFAECRETWDELTVRTGWKAKAREGTFVSTWSALLECPGVSIVVGRNRSNGRVAGFLVLKTIGSTAYVDTIAARNEALKYNINDALMYTFVSSARQIERVTKVHYAIRSDVEQLESFKTSIGFEPFPYPAHTRLRGATRQLLSIVFPDKYARMTGRDEELGSGREE